MSQKDMGFSEGETVPIRIGPLSGFTGKIEAIPEDQMTLRIAVNLLGQSPSVELGVLDIEKIGVPDFRNN